MLLVMSRTKNTQDLPGSQIATEDLPIHWFLARAGRKILRPGGAQMTRWLLDQADIHGNRVLEIAPGVGWTAQEIMSREPQSYYAVEQNADAAALVNAKVKTVGKCVVGNAQSTGLPNDSVDVVVGEAMLTLQNTEDRRAIVTEAARVLTPGGRYIVHELALQPDSLNQSIQDSIRTQLGNAMRVNAQPQTCEQWYTLLESAGFTIAEVRLRPTSIIGIKRTIEDEGFIPFIKILWNVLTERVARRRVFTMERLCRHYKDHVTGIGIVAIKNEDTHE